MPPKFAELTDFASRTFVNYDDDAYNDNSNIASHRMISSPRRRSSNQQQQQQHTSDMSAAPLLMTIPVPTSARDVARTIETSRRYTSMQMLSILAFLANVAFLLLALRGYVGDGTLYYYVIVLYHTKLTPAWWTFLALPAAHGSSIWSRCFGSSFHTQNQK
jgi:hypothetical protein